MAEAPNYIKDLLESRAREDPARRFLLDPGSGGSLGFGELESLAASMSANLARLGLVPGDRVAVCARNGLAAASAVLGIISAGLVVVPAGPCSSAGELAYVLENSGARAVIAIRDIVSGVSEKLAGLGIPFEGPRPVWDEGPDFTKDGAIILLPGRGGPRAGDFGGRSSAPEQTSAPEQIPEDLAVILHTSGTTGRPKGVMLTRGSLSAECRNIAEAHQLKPEDKVLCLLPLNHVNGLVVTLLTPLHVGLEVVMPERFRASLFWSWVRGHQVRWVSAVPTILSILLNRGLPADREDFSSLRFIRSASSALPKAVLEEFENGLGVPVIESYGITEAGSQVASNPLPPLERKAGSVGLAFGCEAEVFDEDGKILGPNERGEVGVRGGNLFAGYHRDPGATAGAFKNGWFMTGDLGHKDGDGYLHLSGRLKELINRGGEMISPREIDEVLHRVPGVELAASVGVPHWLYGEEVVAFVSTKAGVHLDESALREACLAALSPFKTPKRFYFTGRMPKGPSGKIQRLRLVSRYEELRGRGLGVE
ncbi:MAG: AMP-binding protein [Deltaproteobacteria bacterium]|jgi:acyl-CoA synthetase (AMP-forming)/AMP-acid ligase II|nr:AMP-binding protein [Deltaproteobacteria bacterium]